MRPAPPPPGRRCLHQVQERPDQACRAASLAEGRLLRCATRLEATHEDQMSAGSKVDIKRKTPNVC
jgi:hypothetical protein